MHPLCIIQSIFIIIIVLCFNSRFVEVVGTVNPDMTVLEHRVGFLNDEFGISIVIKLLLINSIELGVYNELVELSAGKYSYLF